MSLDLLLPAALGALFALLIPLAIHLARRTESRRVTFAALRWLDPRPRPQTRLTLEERVLLAARLLLLALLALWLARPVLWDPLDRRAVVAVAPELGREAASVEGRRAVWLAPGFPPLASAPPRERARLTSLLRELDATLPQGAPLEVVVPSTLTDADAERPRLSRAVTWRVVEAPAPLDAAPAPPPRLVVRHAPEAAPQARWFEAAAIAWAGQATAPAFEAREAAAPLPPGARHVIWLAPGPLPDPIRNWIASGGAALLSHDATLADEGRSLVVWRDSAGAPLATMQPLGAGRVLRLTRPLDPAATPALLEPGFPDALLRLLQPPPLPARVRAADHAPLQGTRQALARPHLDLRPWWAVALGFLFLLERWLATRARAAAPP